MTILTALAAALFPAIAWRAENSFSNQGVASVPPTMPPTMLALVPPMPPAIEAEVAPENEYPAPLSKLFETIPATPALALRAFIEDVFECSGTDEVLFPHVRRDYDQFFAANGWPPMSDRALGSALVAAGFRKRVTRRNDKGERPTAYILPAKLKRAKKPKTKKGRKS